MQNLGQAFLNCMYPVMAFELYKSFVFKLNVWRMYKITLFIYGLFKFVPGTFKNEILT